ncbi:hypothetical protein ONZ45_g4006 [Pleurotus djamor]|nr:hypothetical protein ONZ45_g4006 [Pleurotus djamor]
MAAAIEKVESGNASYDQTLTTKRSSLWDHLDANVDPAQSTGPLAAFCFMTGFMDAITFSSIFLSIALARLFEGPRELRDMSFHKADQQALCSLITFNLGAFVGRLGDKMGNQTRKWLMLGTFIQALFTMAAAIAVWKSGQLSIADDRGDPAWTNTLTFVCIGFMSASLGVQGIIGKRLNTQFTTTIVLTTVWVELMSDPSLFTFRKSVITRDHKLIAAFSLFTGAFVSRAILFQVGSAGTLGVAVGIRVLIALSWFFVPNKKTGGK